ncbi:unnamed protein product [Closterium sp. NIES-54]
MEVTRTSMIHASAPHFLWPFAVQYGAHQINLQPRVSLPETTPTLRWTGKVGDASAFRVWGSRAFVRDTSADKLSSRAVPCDVTFDEAVSYYRLFPYRAASLPPLPLFLTLGTPPVDPLPPQGPTPSGVSQVDPAELVEVAVDSGAARGVVPAGAGTGGADPEGAEPERVECGGAEPASPEPGGAESERVEPGGAVSGGAESGGSPGVPLRREPLSLQQLCELYARHCRGGAGAGAAGGAVGAGATGGATGAGAAGGASGAAGPGGARTGGPGAAGAGGTTGVGAAGTEVGGAAGVVTGDPGAEGTGAVSAVSGGAARPGPYYVPLLQQVLGLPPSPRPPTPFLSPQPVKSESQLQPSSTLPGPSPYSGPTRGLTERRERESRPVSPVSRPESPVCTARAGRVLRPRPPPVPGTHSMTLRPSTSSQAIEGPYSSQWQAATDAKMASWKSTGTYVDEVPPPGANIVSGMWILRVKRPPGSPPVFKARYVAHGFRQRQGVEFFQTFSPTPKMTTLRVLLHVAAYRNYELHSLDFSTAFLQGSLHEKIWLRRRPGFTGLFPAGTQWSLRRLVYGLRQAPREWHNTLRTTLAALGFAPSTADPSLFLRTDTTLPPFYVLVYVDDLVFATADTEALAHVKSELQKRHTCTDLGELTSYIGLRITRDRAQRTITLTQSHMVQQVLQCFGFTYSSPQSTPLPTGHLLSAPPSDESVEPSGPYPELVGCLITSRMGLVLGGRARVVLTGHADASWVDDLATQRSSQGYTFSLGSGSVSWRSTRSSSVLSLSCEAEIYVGGMAA